MSVQPKEISGEESLNHECYKQGWNDCLAVLKAGKRAVKDEFSYADSWRRSYADGWNDCLRTYEESSG